MENRMLLSLEKRRELLHEFHWPKAMFPDKHFISGTGLKSECDYYKIPVYEDEIKIFLKKIK